MKRKSFCLLPALALLILCGCAAQDGPTETAPPLERSLNTCADTSEHQMAETESGYYRYWNNHLYYADKADLTNWVLVCNDPHCTHSDDTCPAYLTWSFYYRDGLLYTCRATDPKDDNAAAYAVYASNADGTDLHSVYDLTICPKNSSGFFTYAAAPEGLYLSCSTLQSDGTYLYQIGCLDDGGLHTLYSQQETEAFSAALEPPVRLRGDYAAYSATLSGVEYWEHLYRFTPEGYAEVPNLCQYPLNGAYLDGNLLYRFEQNDGYYVTDLTTGESTKRMDAQLTDSRAAHFGPDFLVEVKADRESPSSAPELLIYSGGTWEPVSFPEDLTMESIAGVAVCALSTTHLFLELPSADEQAETTALYAVDLTAENLEAVFCAEFGA